MNLFTNHFFVVVFDNRNCIDDDYANTQCFHLDSEQLEPFLKMCKENGKYVQIEIDYGEDDNNGEKID